MPIQERRPLRVELEAPFEGWYAVIDANFTLRQLRDLNSRQVDRIGAAIGTMLVEWNFTGKDGADLSADTDGVDELTVDVIRALTNAIAAGIKLPN